MTLKPIVSRPALTAGTTLSSAAFRGLGAAAKPGEEDPNAGSAEGGEGEEEEANTPPKKKNKKTVKKPAGKENEDGEGDGENNEDEDEDEDGDECRAEDGDDESDESDMRRSKKNASVRNARLRERRRMIHILESGPGKANVLAALNVALNTDMGREKAVAFLKTVPAAEVAVPESTLDTRMAGLDGRNAGRDAAPSTKGKAATDALWADAVSKHAVTAKK